MWRKKNFYGHSLLIIGLLLIGCKASLQIKSHQFINSPISSDSAQVLDQSVLKTIAPYKAKVDGQMNERIMVASADLTKESPEGSLGNMVCDVLMRYAIKQGNQPDVCVLNAGGLRIPTIYKGDILVRTVFELLPFDNQLVMLQVSGAQLKELLDLVAQNNGWPVAGLRITIKDKKAESILIKGEPIDLAAKYWVLTSDYLAGGGDNAAMLKQPLQHLDFTIMLRDALIAQLKNMFYDGETLQAVKDGRITKE
jgi:2',3'-cyclic-nucleotide 2'-phosphodiesterase (5'-nucleotidase family)